MLLNLSIWCYILWRDFFRKIKWFVTTQILWLLLLLESNCIWIPI